MVSQAPQLTLRCCRHPREGFPSFANHYPSAKAVPLTMREGSSRTWVLTRWSPSDRPGGRQPRY